MVLYFSATGNTEFIAQQIAKRLDDTCIDLLDRIKSDDHSILHSDTPFVICAPVYVCEMPRFLRKYLKKQEFSGSRQVYFIFTSGGYSGVAGKLAKPIFRKKHMEYCGYGEFIMPRNYVASNAFPMLEEDKIKQRIEDACKGLDSAAEAIRRGGSLQARRANLFETIVTVPFNPVWSKFMFRAKAFHTTDKCIGCGKCAKVCPLNNITLKDKQPVWGKHCTHCMACICSCPTEAIDYGTITQNKDKYHFKKYSHFAQR